MKKKIITICAAVLFLTALGLTLYPLVSNYVNQKYASEIQTAYQELIQQTDDSVLQEAKQRAIAYNLAITPGTANAYSEDALLSAAENYNSQLDIAGNGIIGYVIIPKIQVNLPIYHGTDAEVLDRGVGHLLGSSLPVGGKNTHTILSGHSGMASQKMFTDLEQLVPGDVFYLNVLGETMAYQVTELIQLITDRNNLNDVDTWMFFKWVFKSACAVVIVTHTWDIVMGIFEASQSVVSSAAGVIVGHTNIDISSVVGGLESRLNEMDLGPLVGLWFQSLFVGLCTWAITICIFIITYGRMIEVFLVTSVAPIPMATMVNREWGQMGQNYLRTLFSLGFQAFLIVVCVAIYSVLVQNISVSGDISAAIWTCMGYTVLLCFCLFKTSSLARSVFNAH